MNRDIADSVVAMMFNIRNQLIMRTPVATGWAQSNWGMSFYTPIRGTPGVNLAIAEGLKWEPVRGPIYLVNNVHYIEKLNAGHSKQAPPNFVGKSIGIEVRKANRKKIK